MGASLMGRECAREIWYSFHWATKSNAEGRMVRLWNRGHLEEARFIALLLMIGATVIQQDENGKQFRISDAGGHYGGAGDGKAQNLPDLPNTEALTEFKTHNNKSFEKLAGKNWKEFVQHLLDPKNYPAVPFEGEGVRAAKFEHWVQMQQYMRKMNIPVAMYFAVNKDNDSIYAEIVHLDPVAADRYIGRALQLIPMTAPPEKINPKVDFYKCNFCDHKPVCKLGAPVARNCRTCESAEPKPDGTWYCNNKERQIELLFPANNPLNENYTLTKQRQLTGCDHWVKNKAM